LRAIDAIQVGGSIVYRCPRSSLDCDGPSQSPPPRDEHRLTRRQALGGGLAVVGLSAMGGSGAGCATIANLIGRVLLDHALYGIRERLAGTFELEADTQREREVRVTWQVRQVVGLVEEGVDKSEVVALLSEDTLASRQVVHTLVKGLLTAGLPGLFCSALVAEAVVVMAFEGEVIGFSDIFEVGE